MLFRFQIFAIGFLLASDLSSQNLPYSCNFDSSNDQAGWTYYQEGVDGSSSWNMSGGGYSSPNALTHDYNVGASKDEVLIDWMVSPALITDGPFEVSLMVRQTGFSTPTNDNCEMYIIVGDPDPTSGSAVLFGNLSAPLPSGSWVSMSFVNTTLVGEFRIAFRYKTVGPAWSTYAIDDIEITSQSAIASEGLQNQQPTLSIYPNPFNSSIRIDGLEKLDSPVITIIDALGHLVRQESFNTNDSGFFHFTEIPSGYYTLFIRDNKGVLLTERVCKI